MERDKMLIEKGWEFIAKCSCGGRVKEKWEKNGSKLVIYVKAERFLLKRRGERTFGKGLAYLETYL